MEESKTRLQTVFNIQNIKRAREEESKQGSRLYLIFKIQPNQGSRLYLSNTQDQGGITKTRLQKKKLKKV